MTQVVIDPATHAAIQAVKEDVAAISMSVAAISKGIKSVQRGVSTPTTASSETSFAISAVDTSKATVTLLAAREIVQIRLSSSTTLAIKSDDGSGAAPAVSWEVVEWY